MTVTYVFLALALRVHEEGAVLARVHVVEYVGEERLVELEALRLQLHELPHAVDELHENGRAVGVGVLVGAVADARMKAVAEAQPLFLDEHLEAAQSAIVSVEHEHGERGELSGAVPAVRAVHEHRLSRVDQVGDATGCLEHESHVLEPARRVSHMRVEVETVASGAPGLAHHVDVLDVHERELAVHVVLLVLVAAAGRAVGQRVQIGPRVHNVQHRGRRHLLLLSIDCQIVYAICVAHDCGCCCCCRRCGWC